MLSNKTKGEKRKMFLLLWIVIYFGYYHVRFTGGIVIDLVNNIVVSDPSDPAILAEESVKSYLPLKESLEQELEELVADTENDQEEAMNAIQLGGTQTNLDTVTVQADEVSADLEFKQEKYVSFIAKLIDKSDTSTEEAQLLSSISKLAARTGIELVETTPVTTFSDTGIKNRENNSISTIPQGKRAVIGSPVVTDAQADEILSSELFTCRKYKFTGSPLLFYVFLKQLEALEQDVFILDTSITKSKSNNDDSPQIVFTMMLVY